MLHEFRSSHKPTERKDNSTNSISVFHRLFSACERPNCHPNVCVRVCMRICVSFGFFGECLLVMPFRTHRELVRCCVLAWHEFFCVIKMICRAKCSLDTIFLVHHKTITVNQSGSQSLNNTQSVRTFHSNYPY